MNDIKEYFKMKSKGMTQSYKSYKNNMMKKNHLNAVLFLLVSGKGHGLV